MGTVEVLREHAIKKMIWREADQPYYPLGIGDHDYCVVKLTISRGRDYASFHHEDFIIANSSSRLNLLKRNVY